MERAETWVPFQLVLPLTNFVSTISQQLLPLINEVQIITPTLEEVLKIKRVPDHVYSFNYRDILNAFYEPGTMLGTRGITLSFPHKSFQLARKTDN